MRSAFLTCLLLAVGLVLKAQTQPPAPTGCFVTKGSGEMTITGSTTFLLDDLTDFTSSEAISTININVNCNKNYKVSIAGEIIDMVPSTTNTIIPIGTFMALATDQVAGAPVTPVTLTGVYQTLIQNGKTPGSSGRNHQLTITRNALSSFTQAPGGHTLRLHFYFCQTE